MHAEHVVELSHVTQLLGQFVQVVSAGSLKNPGEHEVHVEASEQAKQLFGQVKHYLLL